LAPTLRLASHPLPLVRFVVTAHPLANAEEFELQFEEDMMIVRLWHGRTAKEDFEAYSQFMRERAAPDYASVEGNLECYFLRRLDDDAAHFLLVTHWSSMDAVKAFAGPDPQIAKYYPEDDDFLLEKEPTSQLYEAFHKA
jgi:heme-degrading monooxygenase HmoA